MRRATVTRSTGNSLINLTRLPTDSKVPQFVQKVKSEIEMISKEIWLLSSDVPSNLEAAAAARFVISRNIFGGGRPGVLILFIPSTGRARRGCHGAESILPFEVAFSSSLVLQCSSMLVIMCLFLSDVWQSDERPKGS